MSELNLQKIIENWEPVLNAEGVNKITDKRRLAATALMLQNEWNYMKESEMVSESNYSTFSLNRAGGYSTSGDFHKIAIPMVRRTFPELVAHELVGVQPMAGPVGIAFALRFKAGQTYNSGSNTELGYNTIDSAYSGSMVTSAGEVLGSYTPGSPATNTPAATSPGLGIGSGDPIKEVNLTIEKAQVEAKTRKLRSRWSLEVAQDIKAMHGLSLEEEMMDILAYEITAEIDREIIGLIRTAANTNAYSHVNGQLGTLSWSSSADFDGRWEHEKYRNLYNRTVRDANRIAVLTRRGAGNFVVANPTICASYEGTSAFTIAPVSNDVNTSVVGVAYVGTLDNRMKLFRDTFATSDEYVVGYKGASAYDSGIIYLPYIQLLASKVTMEDSFNPALGLLSRYGVMDHLFGASLYYVRAVITDMP